jgi:hypothetical protein
MRIPRALVAAVAALLLPGVAVVAGDSAAWERAIRRLGSAAVADREAAERELVAAGAAALPTVVASRAAATGETAFRLEWIQRELERRTAVAAVEPAAVSLVAHDLPARAALAEVFARSGGGIELAVEVAAGAAGRRGVTLALERATFWESVDAILDAAGLALECSAGPPPDGTATMRITDAGPEGAALDGAAQHGAVAPHVAAGPVRVSVVGVEPTTARPDATGAASTTPTGSRRGARVTLRVAFEPRLEPLLVRLPARSLVAEGPAGEAMPAAQRAAVVEATVPRGRPWIDLPVRLSAAAVPLERLGMLRGTLELWLAGLDYDFRFPGVRPGLGPVPHPPQRVAAAEVRLLECAAAGDRLSVRASITYDAPSEALASHHSWLASRRLEAVAAVDTTAGNSAVGDDVRRSARRLDLLEQRVEARSDRGLTAAASFALPTDGTAVRPRDVEIRWTLPAVIHHVPVDFAILAVPLPGEEAP